MLKFPSGSRLSQITRGENKGKWRVYGMFGVQNSLKRFANTPIHIVKWQYNGESKTDFPLMTSGKPVLEPFATKEEAEKWCNTSVEGVEILETFEMTLTEDQISK